LSITTVRFKVYLYYILTFFFWGTLHWGPLGWLAVLSAKPKGTHTIALQFKEGKKSLIEVGHKIHSALRQKMF